MTSTRSRTAAAAQGGTPSATSVADDRRRTKRRLDRLAGDIEALRVAGQRFLSGDLRQPPVELRDRVRAQLRDLRGEIKGVAETFRLSSLEARLNAQLELFERRVQAQEISVPRRPSGTLDTQPDPRQGVVIGERARAASVEALYRGLYPGDDGAKPVVDLERFRAHLRRNVEIIRAKTGCRDVLFRIAVEDGKAKLKAKPLRAQSDGA